MQRFQKYILLFLAIVHLTAQGQMKAVKAIEETDMPGIATCFLFSQKGFFYTGTNAGLFLFDGIRFRPLLKKEDSVGTITALAETKNGELWIGCENGNVYRFINNNCVPWRPEEGLPKKTISSIVVDAADNIWLATKGEGIYVYANGKLYNINTDDGFSDNYVYDLELVKQQVIAATDRGISICSFEGKTKQIKNITTSNGLADNIVQTITPNRRNGDILWLGFQNGCAGMFDVRTQQYTNIICTASPVNSLLDLEQELWIVNDAGITLYNKEKNVTKENHLLPGLLNVTIDTEANIWFLHNKGLYKTSGEQLHEMIQMQPSESEAVHDLLVDADGSYWITAKEGVAFYQNKNGNFQKQIIQLPLSLNSEVTCLYMDAAGKIWVGTMGDGLFVIDAGTKKARHVSQVNNLQTASILAITGNEKQLWITSLEGVWRFQLSTNQFESFNTAPATGSAYIYYVLEDSRGRVWFATDGRGITVWQNGSYQSFREKDGLHAKVIYSLAEDKNGNIWCNTLNNGIYKYDGKTFIHYGIKEGLPDLNISSISTDDQGNIFCISAKECFVIHETANAVVHVGGLPADELLNTNLNSSYSNKSSVWFHAGNHIYKWALPRYKTVLQPQTRILNVLLYLDDVDIKRKMYGYNENNLSFNFAGFYYSSPAKVAYSYKLDNYNNQWQYTKDGYVNFPKLSPGSYTFRVRSSVNGNFENANEATYTFTIEKPYWKRWWFVLLSITAVTGLLIFIIRARDKEVQKIQQLQTEKLKAQYETLKNQVNPHFLFNSFNTLLNIIDEDPSKASTYVEQLSDFYRSIVNLREKDLIPLGDELKIIEHYFFIQQKRFGTALHFENKVSEQDKAMYSIPPLSLQLLAENALKHNIISKDMPLTFQIAVEHDALLVKNNLHVKPHEERGEGLGLLNIKNRFHLIAGKEVMVTKTETEFIVTLPLIKAV